MYNGARRAMVKCSVHGFTFAIRLFVESILRYGLPPSFLAGVKPHAKCEKLRAVLTNTFEGASSHWNADPEEDKVLGEDTHPYVTINM